MTALSVVQSFAQRTGLSVPSTLFTNPDAQVLQLVGLLEEVLEDLATHGWQKLRVQGSLTTVAGEDQGELAPVLPPGFRCFVNDTLYDSTTGQKFYGVELPQNWALSHAGVPGGVFPVFRLIGGHLWLSPAPGQDHELAYEALTSFAVLDAMQQPKASVTADTDTFHFPESLLVAGLRWKWKYEKGLEYAEDLRRYEVLRVEALEEDTPKPVYSLDNPVRAIAPGIVVPSGSWRLP